MIVVGASALFIVAGLVGFGFSFFAAPGKAAAAAALAHYSAWSLGIGLFIGVCHWLLRRLMDY